MAQVQTISSSVGFSQTANVQAWEATSTNIESSVNIKATGIRAGPFIGAYSNHNKLVRDFNGIKRDNKEILKEENFTRSLIHIPPCGGGYSCFGDLFATLIFFLVFIGPLVLGCAYIWADIPGTWWPILCRIVIVCTLLWHFVILILASVNCGAFGSLYPFIIEVTNGNPLLNGRQNKFYEISFANKGVMERIKLKVGPNHGEILVTKLQKTSDGSIDIMLYSSYYKDDHLNGPVKQMLYILVWTGIWCCVILFS